MTVVKNRSTPKGREFWDHVEAVAGKTREGDKVPYRVIDAPIPPESEFRQQIPERNQLLDRIAELKRSVARLEAEKQDARTEG